MMKEAIFNSVFIGKRLAKIVLERKFDNLLRGRRLRPESCVIVIALFTHNRLNLHQPMEIKLSATSPPLHWPAGLPSFHPL